jgi:iron complex outermembrane receptor protein
MKKLLLLFIVFFACKCCFGQSADSSVFHPYSSSLQTVTISAFETKTKWKDAAVTVAVLNKNDIQRFDPNTMVAVMNTVPGVRMEERSPESYRLSIRGSLLRSPFGVRDVKIYLDGMPFTDATGNTYLNLIDPNQLQSVEIIKGPAGSLYGANTGGVVLLNSQHDTARNSFGAGLNGGSYGLFGEQASWQTQQKGFFSGIQQSHVQTDGYRQQTATHRDVIKWNGQFALSSKESLSVTAFYTDLFYQTPGGLTQAQFNANPKQARPSTATIPGSVIQKASITNKTPFVAAALTSKLGGNFTNTTSVVTDHTDFTNPFLTNYEKRNEWNYNARTNFGYSYQKNTFKLDANVGGEIGYNVAHINDWGNSKGVPDTVQDMQLAHTTQYFIFGQVNIHAGNRWLFQVGASNNTTHYWYNSLPAITTKQRAAGPLATPRISALYQLTNTVSMYASAARGFSTPTLAELSPSGSHSFSTTLQPEYGWNYEAGLKGSALKTRFEFNLSVYYFALKDAIVSRTDSTGTGYFVNAGGTVQKGVEVWFKTRIIHNNKQFISGLDVWNSLSYQPYHFTNYISGTSNYSGNKLTGVPRTINVAGVDVNTNNGWYLAITFNYTSSLPVNDANTYFANAYHLLQARFGKTFNFHSCTLNIFAGGDNLLNEVYSLGNDINAVGNRFYNAAPARNFFAGAKISL